MTIEVRTRTGSIFFERQNGESEEDAKKAIYDRLIKAGWDKKEFKIKVVKTPKIKLILRKE